MFAFACACAYVCVCLCACACVRARVYVHVLCIRVIVSTDINECDVLSPCDLTHGLCVNIDGSFLCGCLHNYTLGANNLCRGTWWPPSRGRYTQVLT